MATSNSPMPPDAHETSVPELALDNEGLEVKPEPTVVTVSSDDAKSIDSIETTTTGLFRPFASGSSSRRAHSLGLDINSPHGWNGSQYNDYDVITVHGIRDDPKVAWTDENGTWWVNNDLFGDLSTRQVDYLYQIDATATIFEPDGVVQHAQKLITQYARLRQELEETETDRPIIWICHDLGGTIAKQALSMAMQDPATYGKIGLLTTAIIFLGTPHRCQSEDLEDQLCKLLLLPGPAIRDGLPSKVKELSRQVTKANRYFLDTKLLDRAAIFNVFTLTHPTHKIGENDLGAVAPRPSDKDDENGAAAPVTPFPPDAHRLWNLFERPGSSLQIDLDHLAFIRGGAWVSGLSSCFNSTGFPLEVNYRNLPFQAWLLSLAPPTRSLDTSLDPTFPVLPWIREQGPYAAFTKPGGGPRLLHLHANGNPSLDIARVSRLVSLDFDAVCKDPGRAVLYFEFDQHDSRYNTLSSMLLYLINAIAWRFWGVADDEVISAELVFLNHMGAWSLDDLFHVYSVFKCNMESAVGLGIFIGCFDQCPAEERHWFLERVLADQRNSDSESRYILSTSSRDGLIDLSFPDQARINLDDNPALYRPRCDGFSDDLRSALGDLIANRPIYEDFRPQLEGLLEQCDKAPHLGRIILTWLAAQHRGKPRSRIAIAIGKLSPPTADNLVQNFVACLTPALRIRAETVFNWVKHAAEPWSPESLTEALAVHEFDGAELSFDDLDVEATMSELDQVFGGIISLKGSDVKFSHPSFYQTPEIGLDESGVEAAAKVNSAIAKACLCYFQLNGAQERLAMLARENLNSEGLPWQTALDSTPICSRRTSMAEYAVRFWHRHYIASGQFKPRELVDRLFASPETRTRWEVPWWILSNPFTRIQRCYISTLPVLAMLGLEELLQEKIQNTNKDQATPEKDCWFAITEAARAGHKEIVQQLLRHVVAVDEKELQMALRWAASRGDAATVNLLLDKIPEISKFHWPDDLIHQATAAGLDDLLAAMLLSGCDIDETCDVFWGAPPVAIAAWRQRVSTMEILLNTEHKPDLEITDTFGDTPFITATASRGQPRIVELLLQHGVNLETKSGSGTSPVQVASVGCSHKVLGLLIEAGAHINDSSENADGTSPALTRAVEKGSQACVRLLLTHGADPNVEDSGTTALYDAVVTNQLDIARLLLDHDPKPDLEKTPEGGLKLLMRAISTGNTELVSLLIHHGAELDFVDLNENFFSKTPLSRACTEGNLEIVKLLLKNGANINYTGSPSVSDSPLVAALQANNIEVAKYLLEDQTLDTKWAADDGTTALHSGCGEPDLVSVLLKRGTPMDGHSTSFGTVLHAASKKGYHATIEVLLAHDPKPEVDAPSQHLWMENEIGFTPLQLACKYGFPKCVELLLKNGADPRFKNKNGDDSVDVLLRWTESDSADALECLRLLLRSAPYSAPVDQGNRRAQTRLHGIGEKTPVALVRLLANAKEPLDDEDDEGSTPLSVAVSMGNVEVVKFLAERGASIERRNPRFGSNLHLAVSRGDLNMAKCLVDLGADPEVVNPDSGESLLYTALEILVDSELVAMVRYLVDEAKVSVNKRGGVLGYPIIRAAALTTQTGHYCGLQILTFLIRRNAQVDVADSQGRRAVHMVSRRYGNVAALRVLIKAGAELGAKDKVGRKLIHFAAPLAFTMLRYLRDNVPDIDFNETDIDNWTPLLWAARSGTSPNTIDLASDKNVDFWARGNGLAAKDEWSALKLLNFRGQNVSGVDFIRSNRTWIEEQGEWDDDFHKVKAGDPKGLVCESCFANILGMEFRCTTCTPNFSLCFKCYGRRSALHIADHEFDEIGPLYLEDRITSPVSWQGSHDDDDDDEDAGTESDRAPESSQGVSASQKSGDVDGSGNDPRSGDLTEDLDFDADPSSEDGDEAN